jgi:hypothetical protein
MLGRTLAGLALAALSALHTSCLLLPVRSAPGIDGRVFQAGTRRPLAEALVVVRFDGRHGDLIPDRELIGHVEVRTDAEGRFRVPRHFEPGVALWPLFQGETRVVSVLAEGHRCPRPQKAARRGPLEIALAPARDRAEQRASCRPVAARPGEAVAYMAAWRELFEDGDWGREREEERRLDQILGARAALGFGENCEGPAIDLALSGDGERAAIAVREKREAAVHVVELAAKGPSRPVRAGAAPRTPPRRLAWADPRQLVLWEPLGDPLRSASFGTVDGGPVEVIWRAPKPSAPEVRPRAAPPASPALPLEPEDIYDQASNRWEGRGFELVRGLDPETGLARDRLRVVAADGARHEIELPGEPCGPTGHFGRPQYRIAADGIHAVDLRFTDGGCRAVWIDLASGAWSAFGPGRGERAVCRSERRIPPSHLGVALRGYLRQVEEALGAAGVDPMRAYALRIDPKGRTQVETRDAGGQRRLVGVAPFPVATPLQIVHVSNVSTLHGVRPAKPTRVPTRPAPAPRDPEAHLEPL